MGIVRNVTAFGAFVDVGDQRRERGRRGAELENDPFAHLLRLR